MARQRASLPAETVHMLTSAERPADRATRLGRLLLSVDEACAVLGWSRVKFYREMNQGRIETLKDGGHRVVPYGACVAYVRLLCQENGVMLDTYDLAG